MSYMEIKILAVKHFGIFYIISKVLTFFRYYNILYIQLPAANKFKGPLNIGNPLVSAVLR